MGNAFAYFVLFSWPVVVFLLFRQLPRANALCWSIIGGYLLLPHGVGINFPVLPTLGKDLIPALAAGLVLLVLGRETGLGADGSLRQARIQEARYRTGARPATGFTRARPLAEAFSYLPEEAWRLRPLPRIFWILVAALVLSPFATVWTNAEPLVLAGRFIPGLGLYDGFSLAQGALMMLLPFVLGQTVLATPRAQRVLLGALVAGGLLYVLPILYELRMSPQLSNKVYGFLAQEFAQTIRGFGYRPVVFLQHGLLLALFMAMACLAAVTLARISRQEAGAARSLWVALGLVLILGLCNSLGALAIFLLLLPLLFVSLRLQILVAALLALILLTYPMLRGAGLIPVAAISSLAGTVSEDRGQSLDFRLRNEDILLAHANQKALFGWGSFGRNRVYDVETGQDISVTDGAWVIVMGVGGWIGYLATYGLLGLPVLLLLRARNSLGLTLETGGLCLILVANLVDSIANATLTPVTWLVAGALAGRLRVLSASTGEVPAPDRRPSRRLARRSLVLGCGLCIGLWGIPQGPARAEDPAPSVPPGVGVIEPLVSFNLGGIADWSSAIPFLDLMKVSRPMFARSPTAWEGMSHDALVAGGWLDAQGWPLAIPPGMSSVVTAWDWAGGAADPALTAARTGVYVLTYEGEGTVQVGLDAQVISSEPGRIVFRNLHGGSFMVSIAATDPNHSGDPIRDITVVRQEYQALHEMGGVFDPRWLALIQDARELRFMDWMQTNWATSGTWETRAEVGDVSYMQKGAPVEVMVALANQTGTDPWFTMPAGASEEYIRNFATYVRDHLDPGLKVHVEYSNEMWNWAFGQTHWLRDQAEAAWNRTDGGAWLDYQVMLATRSALIWDEIFGASAATRVDNVLGTQTAYFGLTERLLDAPLWREKDPAGYVAPASVFDSLAVTTYFGGATMSDPALRAELVAEIKADQGAASAWLTAKLLDPAYAQSIPQIVSWWAANKAIADRYGLDLVAYEGGQHLLQSFGISGMTEADQALLTTFLGAYVRSPEMARLYQVLWAEWARIGDGPFMQYVEAGQASKWGAWGLYTSLGDHNPRADLLEHLNVTQSSWFGSGGGVHYQQGAIKLAGDGDATGRGEALIGTDLDDFLIGGKGRDRFTPGKGQDAISGEGGRDTIILQGTPGDYRLTKDGAFYRLTGGGAAGQGGDVRFRGIELLGFMNPRGANSLIPVTDMESR